MAWKPREKPLTAEEAIELARKELAPFWFHSDPILAAIPSPKGATAHPLDPSFVKQGWLMIFVDPTSYSAQFALLCAEEWHRRFNHPEFHVVVVFTSQLEAMRSREWIRNERDNRSWKMILVLDRDGMLSKSFGAVPGNLPKVALISGGSVIFEQSGEKWFDGTELRVQQYLRIADPGLPLASPVDGSEFRIHDCARIEFGNPKAFPKPGFLSGPKGVPMAKFPEKGAQAGDFVIGGTWIFEKERIVTADPRAFIRFNVSGTELAIVAQALKSRAEIGVELGGLGVYEKMRGEDLLMNDSGHTSIRVTDPRPYFALSRIPAGQREVTLRFPEALTEPVALFGVRMGKR